jgi:hypothetical protein
MKKFLTQKAISPIAAILLVIVSIGGTIGVGQLVDLPDKNQNSLEYLYSQAVKDAMTIESDEVLPVVKLTEDSDMVTFNDKNEVLLVTWHKYPDSYVPGQQANLKYGAVWTFTDKEMAGWYEENKNGVADWELRFEQLIGLPADTKYTHFSAIWVPLDNIKRPAYSWDIAGDITDVAFDDNDDQNFIQWFDSNIVSSYFEDDYPWTRLGYTYDWAADDIEYGLSEFLVEKGTNVTVEFTYTTQEFIQWLEAQS